MECVGFPVSALSAEQKARAEAFIASQPAGDLLSLRLYPNMDVTSDDNVGSGMMAIFSPSAKVDASILSDSLFQVMVAAHIPPCNGPAKLRDDYFASCASIIRGAVDQFPPQPPHMGVRIPSNNKERNVWAPELGGPGSFAGVYSKIDAENHRNKQYYIVARGTVPLVATEIRRRIGAEQPTYRELLDNDEWASLLSYGTTTSRRNVLRSVQNVAEACAVEIARGEDVLANIKDPNLAAPFLALPDWEQHTHSIRDITYLGKRAVAVCYGVVPAADCLRSKDQRFFVASNPYDGISLYELNNFAAVRDALALPSDTGRQKPVSELKGRFEGRTEGIVWEGDANASHPDLHPEAFKPMGAAFKEAMTSFGWITSDHIEKLVPVAVKVWNDSLVRA